MEGKKLIRKAILPLLMIACLFMASCETFKSSSWQAKDFDRPPSWEEDIGRPDRDW